MIMAHNDIYEAAKYYVEHGFSVIPLKPRSKEPLIPWKEYQERLPTPEELKEWFEGKDTNDVNVAIVTGRVSGNLVVLDFDSEDAFKRFYERVKKASEILLRDLSNTWIVKTGKGFHVYFRLHSPDMVPRTRVRLADGIDVKGEGGYVVAPPSVHPSGCRYSFIEVNGEVLGPPDILEPATLTEEEWNKLLQLIALQQGTGRRATSPSHGGFRRLGDNEILRIKELLKDAWVEGQRQFLALFMSGWFAKARIHPVDAARLFRLLAEERGDDELEDRLSTIYYSYRKLYGDIPELGELDELIEEWRAQGVIRRSVSRGVSRELEERVKGKSGVQEILEASLGEERALEIIREIEEILGASSPFRDSVFEVLDYDRQLFAVANLRSLVLVRARREGDRIVYKEKVAPVAPTRVVVYENPLGGVRKYEIVFEGRTLMRPLRLGPAPLEDIVARLRAEGLVYHPQLIQSVLSAVIQGFIRKGKAEIREEIEAPGFYWIDGRLVAVRWQPRDVTRDELREALKLLDELAGVWFRHVVEKFATVVKWGLVAPFAYAMKQRGRWLPWLFLYGSSHTGKTTQGRIVLSIWGLGGLHEKTGTSIDTVPRLGHVLSQSTFPILINEPGAALARDDIVEAMKNAVESPIVRGRYVKGSYMEVPSLAPLILTSNRPPPRDDALLRRFLVIYYSYGEKIDRSKAAEFEERVKPRLKSLEPLGHWVARRILEDPHLLDMEWSRLADRLLRDSYMDAGLEAPEWIGLWYKPSADIDEDIREAVREYLLEAVNNAFFRAVGKLVVGDGGAYGTMNPHEAGIEERLRVVAEKRLLPWMMLRDGEVIITRGFVEELERKLGGIVGSLKGLAELLGWEYRRVKISGRVVRAAVTSLEKLLELLG